MSLPARLGRLQRVSRLGAGGFASVWLYRDDTLHSLVAVKALADNWSQRSDVRERFLAEARILRRADSDHLVRVYDIGETADGTPYFVMSYADGGTLGDLLAQTPLPLGEVADLVDQASRGLSVLHGIGVIHRDVKPQNLLLHHAAPYGRRLVVADLGVAKALAYASGLTAVVGTPAYMAPEQADPAVGLDARADVHALGAVAYHLLTGHVIRSGSAESLLRASQPAPATSWVPQLPPEIDTVVGRAVHPDREQRWDDVAAFASALSRVAADAGSPTSTAHPDGERFADNFRSALVASRTRPTTQQISTPPPSAEIQRVPAAQTTPATQPAGSSRRSRARRLTPVALLLVLAVAGAGLIALELLGGSARPGTSGDPGSSRSSGPDAAVLAMNLPRPWAESERDASTVTYHQRDRDLIVRLSTADGTETPEQTAAAELERQRTGDGFKLLADEPLDDAARTGWEHGWLIRYASQIDGRRQLQEVWYVGESDTTAGHVAAAAPPAGAAQITELLPRALAALPPPRAPEVVESQSPAFSGDWLSTELEGQFRTDVALVQERLNDLGLGKIPVDGDYGALTASKVRQYQVEQGLHADGRVGPQTWADLFP